MCADDDYIKSTDLFDDFKDIYADDEAESDIIEKFKRCDDFFQLEYDFCPTYNSIHILQAKPYNEDIIKVNELCSDIVIVYIKSIKTYAIALTTSGLDMSSNIELAYFLCDRQSPIEGTGDCFLTSEGTEKLKSFRTKGMDTQ
jgi:hypothetical protein